MNKSFKMLLILNIIVLVFTRVHSSRILCVFLTPSISHQVVFREYTKELAKVGHELVILTTDPEYKNKTVANVTEIDLYFAYKLWSDLFFKYLDASYLKRGMSVNIDKFSSEPIIGVLEIFAEELRQPEVRRILEDPKQKFDLIVIESLLDYPLILTKLFNAPAILFSSFHGTNENFAAIGASQGHPFLLPHIYRHNFKVNSFWDRLKEVYYEIKFLWIYWQVDQGIDKVLKREYGEDTPSITELRNNVQMLFINAHPIYNNNRPVPPSVVYLGDLHMKPVKPLPKDLKSYLDNSENGVIYVSFGSNVRPEYMDKDLLDAFLDAFEALPYDVMWKFTGELERKPKNLRIEKWFPQRDLLTHPKIKLFVTQGGLQSTEEAIEAGVPMVGIPLFAEQWHNTHKSEELGIGVKLDAETMTAEDLLKAINDVISDDSYRQNIKKFRDIKYDQPQRPMERAIWWTEHILRHGNGRHLRSPYANISWREYFVVDILLFVGVGVTLVTVGVVYVTCIVVKFCCKSKIKDKMKQS